MYDYFKSECEKELNNDVVDLAIKELNLSKLQVPAFYKDKESHENTKKILEDVGYKFITLALGYKAFDNKSYVAEYIHKLFKFTNNNTGYNPKLFDDTQLVICTRLYHVVYSAILMKDWLSIRQNESFVKWLNNVYIPSCTYLTKSIVHRTSNHGAWGLLGLAVAYKYLGKDISSLIGQTKKHLKNAKKQPWWSRVFGKYTSGKNEYWVENIRTKSGLYYTYYHTIPLLALVEIFIQTGNPVNDLFEEIKKITDQIYLYATDQEEWTYMDQSKIIGIKQLQQLIFPSANTFRDLTNDGKSAVLFEMIDYVDIGEDYKDWYESSIPLNHDGPYRHSSVQKLLNL